MRISLTLSGVLLIGLLFFDVVATLTRAGEGPVTRHVVAAFQMLLEGLCRVAESRRLLSYIGVAVVLFSVVLWIGWLWTGWTLVFLGAGPAIVDPATGEVADFFERVYFAGYAISTLGLGPFVPQGSLWQVLAGVASLSGLFLVTFVIALLVPVVQAAMQKRELALYVYRLGPAPQEMILNAWDGNSCASLAPHLSRLTATLPRLEQRHRAFPVLHAFRSRRPEEELTLRLAVLDETLTLIERGFVDGAGLSSSTLQAVRRALTGFLEASAPHLSAEQDTPPVPQLDRLRRWGLPVADGASFCASVTGELAPRRKRLRALVEHGGLSWDYVEPPKKS